MKMKKLSREWFEVSAKDNRFEELTNLIRPLVMPLKIQDVTKCLEEFELLAKAYGKAKSIVDKKGVASPD